MKTEHIALPTLQLAAALFFASAAHAADQATTYCVDASDLIVDSAQCDGSAAPATFFVVDGAPGGAVGGRVDGAVGSKVDSTDEAALAKAGFTSGGFGKRADEEEEPNPNNTVGVGSAGSS